MRREKWTRKKGAHMSGSTLKPIPGRLGGSTSPSVSRFYLSADDDFYVEFNAESIINSPRQRAADSDNKATHLLDLDPEANVTVTRTVKAAEFFRYMEHVKTHRQTTTTPEHSPGAQTYTCEKEGIRPVNADNPVNAHNPEVVGEGGANGGYVEYITCPTTAAMRC